MKAFINKGTQIKDPSSMTSLETGRDILRKTVKTLPESPGIYKMIDAQGEILYIGKAKNLPKRVISYSHIDKLIIRLQRMVSLLDHVEIILTRTETEALLLEANLIKKHRPQYNILLKDDKSYPYIVINNNHPYPRIEKYRGPKKKGNNYFGPFASSEAVDETLLMLQRVFLLRPCKDSYFKNRKRPCLQYFIKRCSAPCVGKISTDEYEGLVKQAQHFLKGKSDDVQQFLSEKMSSASERMDYEEAARYRDRLQLLNQIQSHQRINVPFLENGDVMAVTAQGKHVCIHVSFFRFGRHYGGESFFLDGAYDKPLSESLETFIMQTYTDQPPPPVIFLSHELSDKALVAQALFSLHTIKVSFEVPQTSPKKDLVDQSLMNAKNALDRKIMVDGSHKVLLEGVQKAFNLPTMPKRIEVFDNSHIQGSHPYGAMIVYTQDNGFDKKLYRKFKIDNKNELGRNQDDYAMMREVLTRRFNHQEDWGMPDLILIDGGLGQLGIAMEVLGELNLYDTVMVAGIAKGPDRNAGREFFFLPGEEPFQMDFNDPILHFLQRIRDESHRFVIGSHRTGRMITLKKSMLDSIPGIGPKRKKALLHHFGSAKSVSKASVEDLLRVPGIDKSVATVIFDYFR
jgi:excinuclease ABC subunit C